LWDLIFLIVPHTRYLYLDYITILEASGGLSFPSTMNGRATLRLPTVVLVLRSRRTESLQRDPENY